VKEGSEKLNHYACEKIVRDDRNPSQVAPLTGAPRQLCQRKSFVSFFRERKKLCQQAKVVLPRAYVALTQRKTAAHVILIQFFVPIESNDITGVSSDNFHHRAGFL